MNIQTTSLPLATTLPPLAKGSLPSTAAIEKAALKISHEGRPVRFSRNLDQQVAFTYSQHAEPFRERVQGQIDEFV